MNTRELTRREELCRSLNMDFDEAAELFSDETLESMQMAKVNGGIWWKLIELAVVAGITYLTTKCDDGPTKMIEVKIDDNTLKLLTQPSDSTFFRVNSDGSFEFKKYGTGGQPTTGNMLPPPPTPTN